MDDIYDYRVFYIPPDKPYRAYVLRHDVLENVPLDKNDFVEISLADGSIIKRISRPPQCNNLLENERNEIFYYDDKIGYRITDLGRNFAVTVTKFERNAGQEVSLVVSTQENSRKFNMPSTVAGYDGRFPLPRILLGDKFWLITLFDCQENRGDGSKLFQVDVKQNKASVVSCLPDPRNGSFPGK